MNSIKYVYLRHANLLRRWGTIFPVKLIHSLFHSLAYTPSVPLYLSLGKHMPVRGIPVHVRLLNRDRGSTYTRYKLQESPATVAIYWERITNRIQSSNFQRVQWAWRLIRSLLPLFKCLDVGTRRRRASSHEQSKAPLTKGIVLYCSAERLTCGLWCVCSCEQ